MEMDWSNFYEWEIPFGLNVLGASLLIRVYD